MKKETGYGYLISPIVLFVLIAIIPISTVFYNAFITTTQQGLRKFVGFQNFLILFNDNVFWRVLSNTGIWTLSMVIVTTIVSLILAMVLNTKIIGVTIGRVLVMLPWTIPAAIYSIIWKYIYSGHFGLLNHLLKTIGLIKENIFWLGMPSIAMVSVIWVGVLNSIPFTVLVLLGGLQTIPKELYEASEIDGSAGWQRFIFITMPLMKYVVMVVTLFNVIYIFRSFSIVWVLTQGGPVHFTEIIATYIYKTAFHALNWGIASALAVIAFLILMVFVFVYTTLITEKDEKL